VQKRARAQDVLDRVASAGLGALSIQVLSELFSNLVRKEIAPPDEAEALTHSFAQAWPICDVDLGTVYEAMRASRLYRWNHFDALIWATAKLNGIPNILSEDGQDGQRTESVRRLNPLLPSFDLAQLS
jgi:predicted nucleic acid-binding protein